MDNSSIGAIIVQTVRPSTGGKTAIAFTNYNYSIILPNNYALIEEETYNLKANAIIQAKDSEFVILGSTDKHLNGDATRSDFDFYITKVGINGEVSSSTGFTNIIGGTGNETGAAIVQADDGGYVILGTMKNTNEVNLMVLVKVNSNGELIN
jgi:hypothetical protein